jgi:hypothetical protein
MEGKTPRIIENSEGKLPLAHSISNKIVAALTTPQVLALHPQLLLSHRMVNDWLGLQPSDKPL